MVNQAKTRVPSAAAHGKKGHTLISDAKFRQLYELTLLMQAASSAAPWLQGREAVLAGVTADLRAGDALIAETASWASERLRSRLPAALRSPAAMTMADLIVESLSGSTMDRLRNNERVTVIFASATDPDAVCEEARALAGAARLPVLFVDDGRAASAPRASNGKAAAGSTMPSMPVDAGDVIAMYRVAHESITRARQGSGPTQILCTRWRVGSGRGTGNGANEKNGAVERLEPWLVSRGLPVQEWREQIQAEIDAAPQKNSGKPGAAYESGGTDAQPFAVANIE